MRNGKIVDMPHDIVQIALSSSYSMILRSNGILMGTGDNMHGQLGLGDIKNRYTFEEIYVELA